MCAHTRTYACVVYWGPYESRGNMATNGKQVSYRLVRIVSRRARLHAKVVILYNNVLKLTMRHVGVQWVQVISRYSKIREVRIAPDQDIMASRAHFQGPLRQDPAKPKSHVFMVCMVWPVGCGTLEALGRYHRRARSGFAHLGLVAS